MTSLPNVLERVIEEVTKEQLDGLEDLEILNSELPITSLAVKSHRLDILIQKGNKYMDLEVNNPVKDYTRIRNFLYSMDKANNMVEVGGTYKKI